MSMLVSSARFAPSFVSGRNKGYNSSQSVQVPAGAKSVRVWALGAGGLGYSQNPNYHGGGGGEMRVVGLVPVVAGQTLDLALNASGDTVVSYGGNPIIRAARGGNAFTYIYGPGGFLGGGGKSFNGGSGKTDRQDSGDAGAGGGAGGTTGSGGDGAQGGLRGSGATLVDADTGASFQNGGGGQPYGGGSSGRDQIQRGGFVVLQFTDVEVLTTVRVRRAYDGDAQVSVPEGYNRAKIILLAGGRAFSYYSEEGYTEYTGGNGGCLTVVSDLPVGPGDVLSYQLRGGAGSERVIEASTGGTYPVGTSLLETSTYWTKNVLLGNYSYKSVKQLANADEIQLGGAGQAATNQPHLAYGGAPAGLYGHADYTTAGPGPTFIDSVSGVQVASDAPGPDGTPYGRGGSGSSNPGAGFCVFIFYSV